MKPGDPVIHCGNCGSSFDTIDRSTKMLSDEKCPRCLNKGMKKVHMTAGREWAKRRPK